MKASPCTIYHLNIFGSLWPIHGKQFFESKWKMNSFLNMLKKDVYRNTKGMKRKKIDNILDDGHQVVSINRCFCPQYESLFKEQEFYENPEAYNDKLDEVHDVQQDGESE